MTDFTPSSKAHPCPVCGRTKDGDCRLRDDGLVLCHTHRGEGLAPRASAPSGRPYRFCRTSTEAQGFGIWKPEDQWEERNSTPTTRHPRKASSPNTTTNPNRCHQENGSVADAITRPTAAQTVITPAEIQLARLPKPDSKIPPDHLSDGTTLPYSDTQRVLVVRKEAEGKSFRPQHQLSGSTRWKTGAGPERWPLYCQSDAITHGRGRWILDIEGEKCCKWLRCAGLVAVSHPGHNHTTQACAERYRTLKDAGVTGVVYIADNDDTGTKKAGNLRQAAAIADLPLVVIPAAKIWPGLPAGGSIDDAIGAPNERAEPLLQAIANGAWQPQGDDGEQNSVGALHIRRKVELQQFLRDTYQLEFNELTRICEINGNPLEDPHLADSFLAQQHGIEVSKQMASDSFEFIAKSNPYNPVHRYLAGLRERSDLRLISMQELAAAFAIEPQDQISQHLLASHLAGAALRGLTPGHKHDQILILRGEQGTFKSSAIEALAGPWYDSATRVEELESKDFLARINGAWLFEIDECEHTLLKRTASEFKGFISRRNDRYAEKYERTAKTHWRRSALFGTTNQAEFLNDSTGNRRAWVIDTGSRELNPQWISANRDSIWATVLTWIDWGLSSYAGRNLELAAAAAERAQEANLSDPWEPLLARVLDAIPVDAVAGIALDDLIEKALNISARDCKRDDQMRVTRVVTGSSFRTHNGTVAWQSKKRRYGGGRARAGYEPMPLRGEHITAESSSAVPTVPTGTEQNEVVGTEVGTGQPPWCRRDLTALFQPVPTFSLRRDRDKEGSPQDGTQGAQRVVTPLPPEVGTGWNTPENSSAGTDLLVPSGLAQQGGWNGTPPPADGTPVPSPSASSEQLPPELHHHQQEAAA